MRTWCVVLAGLAAVTWVLGSVAAVRAQDSETRPPPRYARALIGLGGSGGGRLAVRSSLDVLPARVGATLLGARVGYGGNVGWLAGPEETFLSVGPRVAWTHAGTVAPVLAAGVALAFVERSYSTSCIDLLGTGCSGPEPEPDPRSERGVLADASLGFVFRFGPVTLGSELDADFGTTAFGLTAQLALGWTE